VQGVWGIVEHTDVIKRGNFMKKVKILDEAGKGKLEGILNDELERLSKDGKNVVDIKMSAFYSTDSDEYEREIYAAMIIYEE